MKNFEILSFILAKAFPISSYYLNTTDIEHISKDRILLKPPYLSPPLKKKFRRNFVYSRLK